jgi:hypothetical protein
MRCPIACLLARLSAVAFSRLCPPFAGNVETNVGCHGGVS